MSSSGYSLLDDAAIDTMKRADPLPPMPGELPGDAYRNVIRIGFEPPR